MKSVVLSYDSVYYAKTQISPVFLPEKRNSRLSDQNALCVQLLNQKTDFHKTWYEHVEFWGYPNAVLFYCQ